MIQQQQNHRLRQENVVPEPSSTSVIANSHRIAFGSSFAGIFAEGVRAALDIDVEIYFMINFNVRMVLDLKSEPVIAFAEQHCAR